MKITFAVSIVTALALLPTGTSAQRDGLNPHGVLTVDVGCDACHTTAGWSPTKSAMDFDHGEDTEFPLTGKHAGVACASCHLDLIFSEPKISGCTGCHVDVHRGRLSDDCSSCHNSILFADVPGLEIHSKTSFPLTGSHLQVSCESCHLSDQEGAYTSQQTECYSCHASAYADAQPVDHVAAGFPTECQECHNTLAWAYSVVFDHVGLSGGFALLGRHSQVRCSSCHTFGTGEPIFNPSSPDDCIACHQTDYEREHGGSGFPTTCASCHTNDSWEGATFEDHDAVAFPIFSGAHRGTWASCQTCHTTPGNYSAFTCLVCHEHNQSSMDAKHRGEAAGYVYESNACYSCHPRGRGEGEG